MTDDENKMQGIEMARANLILVQTALYACAFLNPDDKEALLQYLDQAIANLNNILAFEMRAGDIVH
jgi:hypothetical protein